MHGAVPLWSLRPHPMQIHISWKSLLAALIFLLGLILIFRVSIALLSPAPQEVVSGSSPTAPTPTLNPEAPPSEAITPAPEASPSATATSLLASPTPLAQPSPTASIEAAPATATPEPTPEPTLPPPTPTLALPPTRIPTPVPAQLRLIEQGFGQNQSLMSYAFVVSNPNPELLAQAVRYQVAAYDASGVVLATDSETIAQIGPGQELGIARELSLAPGLAVARIDVLLRPSQFVRSPPLQSLEVSNPAFVAGLPPNATGIVNNTFARDLIDVTVFAIAYDEGGIIGGGNSVVPFIPAQAQAAVSVPIATSLEATRIAFWVELDAAPSSP